MQSLPNIFGIVIGFTNLLAMLALAWRGGQLNQTLTGVVKRMEEFTGDAKRFLDAFYKQGRELAAHTQQLEAHERAIEANATDIRRVESAIRSA